MTVVFVSITKLKIFKPILYQKTIFMNLKISHLFFALILSFTACQSPSNQNDQLEGMEQFVEDESFKEAHDEPKDIDFKGDGDMIEIEVEGGEPAGAYALMTENPSNKYLLVIHEWWGLNDQIKQEADRLFKELGQVNVIALDMYDGKVADNRDDAGKYMQAMKQERGEAIIKGALKMAGADTQIATVGWCFGGGWSLRSSILAGDQGAGCVMYYGMPVMDKTILENLEAEVLGIFAKQDGWITPEVAENFKTTATAIGKKVDIHIFDADHAFANPTSDSYAEEAAQQANELALNFLKSKLAE